MFVPFPHIFDAIVDFKAFILMYLLLEFHELSELLFPGLLLLDELVVLFSSDQFLFFLKGCHFVLKYHLGELLVDLLLMVLLKLSF